MFVKIAYRLNDNNGYRFMEPQKFYAVSVFTSSERSSCGPFRDEQFLKIESKDGGACLFRPSYDVGPDSITVKGYCHFNLQQKPPEGVFAPVVHIMQEWVLKVNVQNQEEEEYQREIKKRR